MELIMRLRYFMNHSLITMNAQTYTFHTGFFALEMSLKGQFFNDVK